jgi:hypothetical protein
LDDAITVGLALFLLEKIPMKNILMKRKARDGDDAGSRTTHRSKVDSRGDTYVNHPRYGHIQEAMLTEYERREARENEFNEGTNR